MKILVTGSTGFIGNYVIKNLLKSDNEVLACGRSPKNIIKYNWINNVNYFQIDLNIKKKDWFSFFHKPDIVIHLAWEGLPNYRDLFHFENNLNNNCFFIKNLIENGLKKIIITGTCLEYGMREGKLKESYYTNPISAYSLAKDCLRKYVEQLKTKEEFDFKWIRLFYMYGKGKNSFSILSQLENALNQNLKVFNMSKGDQLRDYLPVEKVAEYIVAISLQNKISGIINCCSGNPIPVKKLVQDYLHRSNQKIDLNLGYYPYPNYEPFAFWGDNKKLKLIFDYIKKEKINE